MTAARVPRTLRREIAERDADRKGLAGEAREDFIREQCDPALARQRAAQRRAEREALRRQRGAAA